LIDIADCDRIACGGTHVRFTGQIGGLQVRGLEKVTRGVRVEFLCGLREALAQLGLRGGGSADLAQGES
jgi:alanyl-tRNA synthetase